MTTSRLKLATSMSRRSKSAPSGNNRNDNELDLYGPHHMIDADRDHCCVEARWPAADVSTDMK